MRLFVLLFVSHLVAVFSCVLSFELMQLVPQVSTLTGIVIPTVVVVGTSYWLSAKLRHALFELERTTTGKDAGAYVQTSILEFDAVAQRLQRNVQRWTTAARRSREQSFQVEELVAMFDRRRVNRGDRPGEILQQIFLSISDGTRNYSRQIGERVVHLKDLCVDLNGATVEQSDAMSKATAYVEQLSESIATVAGHANNVSGEREQSARGMALLDRNLLQLDEQTTKIRDSIEAHEARLRSLVDRFREIGAIADSIGIISSRTDMLALNVSIESVRAGQHGRRFAVVADEVRKLSEQAATAAREVTGLTETLQLETQQLIASAGKQRADLTVILTQADETNASLVSSNRSTATMQVELTEASRAVNQQVHLIQDLVAAIERVSAATRQNRTVVEKTSWHANSIQAIQNQLEELFESFWQAESTNGKRKRGSFALDTNVTEMHEKESGEPEYCMANE